MRIVHNDQLASLCTDCGLSLGTVDERPKDMIGKYTETRMRQDRILCDGCWATYEVIAEYEKDNNAQING